MSTDTLLMNPVTPMPAEVLSILRCLSCRSPLALADRDLACKSCGRLYPYVNGTYKFVGSEKYAASFGFQWRKYASTQIDTERRNTAEQSFRSKTGFTPEKLRETLVLDVGCGMGRFAEVATRFGARVVAIDLSIAVEMAARNLDHRGLGTFLQADVFSLPFAPESFDFIYSIGVLHHTPNCEEAFKTLPPLLKPGGEIAIWLYSAYNPWHHFSDVYRKVTPRMPTRLLHGLCQLARPLYHVHRGIRKIPLLGRPASAALGLLLPTSQDPDPEWRVLDTFDWYSPVYQSKHTYEEVFPWFESCGLVPRVAGDPICVQGKKPLKELAHPRRSD